MLGVLSCSLQAQEGVCLFLAFCASVNVELNERINIEGIEKG